MLPYLPDKKVKNVIVDFRISDDAKNTLLKLDINIIPTFNLKSLYNAVCGHPDMQLHQLNEQCIVCEPTLYNYYKLKLPDLTILKGITTLKDKYPYDIAYNAARVGKCVFHNLKYTDLSIIEYYQAHGVKLINVKQGYTKCSICVLNENAIITSDKMIADLAEKNNIEVLFYNPKEIRLFELSNGFIGGICGKIAPDILAVNGNIERLSDFYNFIDFCNKHKINVLNLSNEIPLDIGSIIPVLL